MAGGALTNRCLCDHDALDGADPLRDQLEQTLVALGDHLGEQVVGTGGDDDVVDLGDLGQRVCDRLERAADAHAHHRLAGEAELERVGDRHDLHHPTLDEALHPLAQAATRAVLLLAARAAAAEAVGRRRSRRHGQQLLGLPALPLELWHLILGLLEPHALGGGAVEL